MYKVYVWTNKVTGKKYVGATGSSMSKRAGAYGQYYKGSPKFYNAIMKYGLANFEVKIVEDGLTKEEAAEVEKRCIKELRTTDPENGYNLQEGGFACVTNKDEVRANISRTLKAQRGADAYRKIMSERMKRVWADPSRKRDILGKRAGKYSGRKRVEIFCDETSTLYPDMHAAAKALNCSVSSISRALKGKDCSKISLRNVLSTYTIHRVVHAKESELLEA